MSKQVAPGLISVETDIQAASITPSGKESSRTNARCRDH